MHDSYLKAHAGLLSSATVFGAIDAAQRLAAGFPWWQAVPPLAMAACTAAGAAASFWKLLQDNRRAEEIHRARLLRVRVGLDGPEPPEPLPAR